MNKIKFFQNYNFSSSLYYLKVTSVVSLILLAGCNKDNSIVPVNENNLSSVDASRSTLRNASNTTKYIVILNNDAEIKNSSVALRGEKMKTRISGMLRRNTISAPTEEVYNSVLQGFSMRMTRGEAKILAGDSNIKSIEEDKVVSIEEERVIEVKPLNEINGKIVKVFLAAPLTKESNEQIPWGVSRVGGGMSGVGKTAWIIDTGIDLTHPDLNVDVERSISFVGEGTSPNDDNGHGTHLAGTIAAIEGNGIGVVGVAAGATVVAVKVLDKNGNGTVSSLIAGIDYVAANGKSGDVANISSTTTLSEALDNAVLNASNGINGVKFVLSAGNQNCDVSLRSPSHINGPNIFTVSAMDSNNSFASFSNFGSPTIDFCAPGVNVNSTSKGGGYALRSGTSQAAPHVAGLLLLGAIINSGYVLKDPDGIADPIAHH
jgi:subtilisin family serine protease